jgi:hypothetical protein
MVKFQHSNEGTVKSTGIGSAEGFSHQGGYGDGIPIAAILIMGDRYPIAASLPWVEQDGAKPLPILCLSRAAKPKNEYALWDQVGPRVSR